MTNKWLWLTIGAVALALAFQAGCVGRGGLAPSSKLAVSGETPTIKVQVVGIAVTYPGLYELPHGVRVYDAIKAAGGLDCWVVYLFPEIGPDRYAAKSISLHILSEGRSSEACFASIIEDGALVQVELRRKYFPEDYSESDEEPLNEFGVYSRYLDELRQIGEREFLANDRLAEHVRDQLSADELAAYERMRQTVIGGGGLDNSEREQLGKWYEKAFSVAEE